MKLERDAMSNDTQPGNTDEWNDAATRVRTYLQALQITNQEQQDRIIAVAMQCAALKQAGSHESLMTLAMAEIHDLCELWFEKHLAGQERAGITGFVALSAMDATGHWPAVFLADEIPPELQRALQECDVRAVPGLKVSRMVPQPFENPLQEVINLPSPLGQLSKERLSLVAKFSAFVISFFSIWTGHRLR